MSTAKAFAPGNVSGVFKIIPDDDPRKMHSLGMGFTVSDGVTVTVAESESTSVHFNGTPMAFSTVLSVVAKLTDQSLRVDINTELPLSGGFGLSGASSLARFARSMRSAELDTKFHQIWAIGNGARNDCPRGRS